MISMDRQKGSHDISLTIEMKTMDVVMENTYGVSQSQRLEVDWTEYVGSNELLCCRHSRGKYLHLDKVPSCYRYGCSISSNGILSFIITSSHSYFVEL